MLAFAVRHRTYVLLSIVTLILCIGANTVVFTIVNALWIRPRPVHDPQRVVVVLHRSQRADGSRFSELALNRLRSIGLFAQVAGQVVARGTRADLAPRVAFAGTGAIVEAVGVTSEYFSVLGLAVRGRDFLQEDDVQGAAVAIISDRLWRTRFAAAPEVIGAIVEASPRPLQIIGVAPPRFHGALSGEDIDLWLPRNLLPRLVAPNGLREGPVPMINFCRLQEGVSLESATAWFAQGQRPSDVDLQVVPLGRLFGAPDSPMVLVSENGTIGFVVSMAALVLAGGCITLMALVIVHYERRRHELCTRMALGATSAHLARQLAAELAVCLCPGVMGALFASALVIRALPSLSLPSGVDLARLDLTADWRVLVAAVLIASAVSVSAVIIPAIRFVRAPLTSIQSFATAGRGSLRLRRSILTAHAAATLLVLVAAGLFVRAVLYGFAQAPGFDVDRTLFVAVQTRSVYEQGVDPRTRSESDAVAGVELMQRIGALPSVEMVALGGPPLGAEVDRSLDRFSTVMTEDNEASLPVAWRSVGPNYLKTIGVPLLLGDEGGPMEAVITPSLANTVWPGVSALGRPVRIGSVKSTVTGIADFTLGSIHRGRPAGVITFDLTEEALPEVLSTRPVLSLAVRAEHPESLRAPIDRLVREAFPNGVFTRITTSRELVSADLGRERLGAWFFSGFGVVTLLLGLVSVYGLVAYLAESRRREFGVMLSLGASHADIAYKAMSAALGPVAAGATIGVCATVVLARTLEAFIFGIQPLDPTTYLGACFVFVSCAAGAAYAATHKLRRLEPMDALRTA